MGVLRLFLALSVLLGHTRGRGFFFLSFLQAGIAVDTFFMISGFYMALVLNEKYNRPGEYGIFIKQRFFRLYPTYLILVLTVLLVDTIASWAIGRPWGNFARWHQYGHLLSPGALAFYVIENIILFGQEIVMLLRLDAITGAFQVFWHQDVVHPVDGPVFLVISPSWSLSIEFTFYLLAPFLVRRSARFQLALLLCSVALRAPILWAVPYEGDQWNYLLFPTNLSYFMAGSLGYMIYKKYGDQLRAVAISKPWLIGIFALVGLDYCRYPFTRQLYLIWIPMAFIMIPTLFALTSRNKLDRLIGELSFPVYLIHSHVLMFTIPFFSRPHLKWLLGAASIVLTLVLAWLYYRFIEIKLERYRENLYRRSVKSLPVKPARPLPNSSAPDPDLGLFKS